MKKILITFLSVFLLMPCVFAIEETVQEGTTYNVKKGLTKEEVQEALGTPSIVAKDADKKETWIYDKTLSLMADANQNFWSNTVLAGYMAAEERTQMHTEPINLILKFNNKTNKLDSFNEFTYHRTKFY
jgi:outer membrane protein assembly factor BamE (lipoprotein component of BamABCDE complex)